MSRFPLVRSPLTAKQLVGTGLVAVVGLLFASAPALAHHPFGGEAPTNAIEGFLSGLGHPVIGLDHLAFTIAAGLLAAVMGQAIVPIAWVLAASPVL